MRMQLCSIYTRWLRSNGADGKINITIIALYNCKCVEVIQTTCTVHFRNGLAGSPGHPHMIELD